MDLNHRFFFLFFFREAHEEFLFISRSFYFSFYLLVEARIAEQ